MPLIFRVHYSLQEQASSGSFINGLCIVIVLFLKNGKWDRKLLAYLEASMSLMHLSDDKLIILNYLI